MAGMKKRLRELEADNAMLREALHREREYRIADERRWQEQMARFGAPYVAQIVSKRSEGVYLAHAITRSEPTPSGLYIEIAP